jgi:hypothetical protein
MDKLEEFIRNNRSQLDRYDASRETWEKIRSKTVTRKPKVYLWYLSAAMFTLIAGISLFFYLYREKKPTYSDVPSMSQRELRETQLFYNSIYQIKYMEAKPLFTSQPDIEKELKSGSAQIDSICADLMKDLKDNVSNKEVIEALIRNYRIKVQLLEDMLNVVRQNENDDKKRTSHEL